MVTYLSFSMTVSIALFVVAHLLNVTSLSGLGAQGPPLRGGLSRRLLTPRVRLPMAAGTLVTYPVMLCGAGDVALMPAGWLEASARPALVHRRQEQTRADAPGSFVALGVAFIPSLGARCLPPCPSASGATPLRCPPSTLSTPRPLLFRFPCLALPCRRFNLARSVPRGPALRRWAILVHWEVDSLLELHGLPPLVAMVI